MKLPYACRPLKSEYIAVGKLLENDMYLHMSEKQFIENMMNLTSGTINPKRARQIYFDLMKDAGINS
jgi:hypothetical protein